jgi:hypothetical protein
MSTIKRTAVLLVAAVMVAAGSTSPAFASKEERIRTETIEIYFPKTFKAPRSGCTNVPIRYEWRYFMNHRSVGAYITLETKNEWIIGEIYLQPEFSGGGGVANLKICASRWVGDEETIDGTVFPGDTYQPAKKGRYFIDLWVSDFDNKDNPLQFPKRKPLVLR